MGHDCDIPSSVGSSVLDDHVAPVHAQMRNDEDYEVILMTPTRIDLRVKNYNSFLESHIPRISYKK